MAAPALVLFDLDDVLVRYDRAARVTHLAAAAGVDRSAVTAALFDSGLERESDRGQWLPPDYAAELSRRLRAPLSLADCIAARAAAMSIDATVLQLAECAAEKSRIAILTNNGFFLRDHLAQMCPPLFPLFADRVFCSAQFGALKPEATVYRGCLERLETPATRTVFIDDNVANVQGARDLGIDALHFTDATTLAGAFADRGLFEERPHAL